MRWFVHIEGETQENQNKTARQAAAKNLDIRMEGIE